MSEQEASLWVTMFGLYQGPPQSSNTRYVLQFCQVFLHCWGMFSGPAEPVMAGPTSELGQSYFF